MALGSTAWAAAGTGARAGTGAAAEAVAEACPGPAGGEVPGPPAEAALGRRRRRSARLREKPTHKKIGNDWNRPNHPWSSAPPRRLPLAPHPQSRSRNPSMESQGSSSQEIHSAASEDLAPSSSENGGGMESVREFLEQWVENLEDFPAGVVPPVCMVIFPDLLAKAWGWEKLLPEVNGSVEWEHYWSYLLKYVEKKKDALKVTTGELDLGDVAKSCIEAENKIIRTCNSFLSLEEYRLIRDIKAQAENLGQSVGEYPVAAATLLAITTEAELMCEMEINCYATNKSVVAMAHQIRQAAFKLILYGGTESEAVIAVMLALVEEDKLFLDALREDSPSALDLYSQTTHMRQGIGKVLTNLGQELFKAVGNVGTPTSVEKLIRGPEKGNKNPSESVPNVAEEMCNLNVEDLEKGNKKPSESLHNVVEENVQYESGV